MKKIFFLLILLCAAFTLTCIFAGCRSVKKSVRTSSHTSDSSGLSTATWQKETTTTEKNSSPITVNPGNLSGQVRTDDTCEQIIESDSYSISYKSDGDKKADIKVKGKDKQVDVPVDKTTNVRESGAKTSEATVQKIDQSTDEQKQTKSLPVYVYIILIAVALLLIIIILKKINIFNLVP